MRMTTLTAVVSSVLLSASMAHAGGSRITQEQYKAADTDRDGLITLAEAQSAMPTLAAQFSSVDSNKDSKVSVDELNTYNESMEADQATSPPTDK